MYLESYDPRVESMVMVSDSTFRSNIATHGSGGAFADIAGGESGMQIYRTKFEDNKASLGGGAIIMSGSKGLVLVDAEFIGNSAGSSGGAFQVDNGKMSMVRGRVVGSLGRPQLIPPEKPTRLTSQEWNWNKCNDPEGEDKCKAGQGVCRGHSDCVGALRCSQKAEYVNTWGWEPLGSYGGLAMCYRPTGAAVHLTTSGLTTMFDVHMAADNRPANITAIPPVTIIESPSLRASVSESQVLELGTEQLITTCVGAAATTQCIELGFLGCTSGSERCSCPAGTIHRHDAFGAASEVCIPCTPGLWSPNIGMAGSACQACPAGYNQPRPRATSCLSCSPGTYQDQTAQTNCLSCSLNTFSAEQNATVCEECDIGRTSEYGAARCATCGAGKFRASTSGSVNCSSCAPNTFSDSPGASNCKSCPTGFKATLNGSVSCSRCGAGRFGAGCVECPIGWARTESAPSSLSCDQCDAGQSSDTKGSAKCTSCGAGRYSNVTGEGCKNCDKGRYRVVGKNENQDDPKRCDACPEGYYQDAEGQASCLPCLPGWFGNVTGMRACHECDIGKVSEGQNATRCSDCDAGQSSDTKGSAKCTSCGAGRYSNVTGEDCKNCPGGWRRGANEPPKRCVQCALGETTKSGAMSCDTCDLGKYGNPSSPGLCVTCEPGKYQDAKGETSCKLCPASRWSGDKEATSLGECKLCSDDRSTGNRTGVWNIRQCMCKKDAYFDDASAAGVGKANINILNVDDETLPACVACPRGAACPVDGSTLMYLHARSGFWQPENQTSAFFDCGSAFSDVALGARARARCCPAAAQCDRVPRLATWKAADQCEPGYSGEFFFGLVAFSNVALKHTRAHNHPHSQQQQNLQPFSHMQAPSASFVPKTTSFSTASASRVTAAARYG